MANNQEELKEHLQDNDTGFSSEKGWPLGSSSSHLKPHTVHGSESPLPQWIIDPKCSWYHNYWRVFVAVLVAIWTGAGPIYFALVPRPSLGLTIFNSVVDLAFFLDMAITFFVAFEDKKTGALITSHKRIAARYLSRGFFLDLLSTIPYHLLWRIGGGSLVSRKWGEVFNALGLLRLYRIPSFFHLLSRFQTRAYNVYFAVSLFKLTLIVVLSAHLAGCCLLFIARQEVALGWRPERTWYGFTDADWQDHTLFRSWLTATYWTIETLTSLGYGDYVPITPFERIIVGLWSIYSLFMLAYILGMTALLLVRDNSHTSIFHEKSRALKAYADSTNLPPYLRRQLQNYLFAEMRVGTDQSSLVASFPPHLRAHVLRYQFGSLVARAQIFKSCSQAFLSSVVGSMHLETVLPNVAVVTEGDVADALYIVAEGTLVRERVRNSRNSSPESPDLKTSAELVRGSVFGKVAVLCNIPQLLTVRAKEVCQLLKLNKADFAKILHAYPEDSRIVLENLIETVTAQKKSNTALSQEVRDMASEVADLLSRQDLEVGAVCSAAAHGNLQRLQELLPLGDNEPRLNMVDYDGCTPLHYAASKGHVECVSYLIQQGADVNTEDIWGTTPLLEAIRSGSSATVRILRSEGAQLRLKDTGKVLAAAIAEGQTEFVNGLLENGADVNAEGYDGRTALHLACAEGNIPLARLLLDFRADVAKKDGQGVTPLDEARAIGVQRLADLIGSVHIKG